jgi:hypothetical protein
MIRPFTLLTAIIFLASGAYMFAIKHRAEATAVQISAIDHQSLLDASRIRVLQAQWALETDPDRLSQLAAAFTSLRPMQPVQLVTLAALASSLPPPGSAVPGQNPQSTAPVTVPDIAAAAPATALPMPPDAAPRLAAAAPRLAMAATARGPVRLASLSDVEHMVHHLNGKALPARAGTHPARIAHAAPPPSALAAASLPMHREVAMNAAPGMTGAENRAQLVATSALVAAPLGGGSLLGMAQTGVGN